jgi:hypothetical protein
MSPAVGTAVSHSCSLSLLGFAIWRSVALPASFFRQYGDTEDDITSPVLRVPSPCMWCRVVQYRFIDISEERALLPR